MWIPMRRLLNAALQGLIGGSPPAASLLNGARVGLLKQTVSVTIDSADSVTLTAEANYSGYARSPSISFTGPINGEGGFAVVGGPVESWYATDTVTLNTIYGQFLIGSDSASVLAVELFNNPIPLGTPSMGFFGVPIFGFGPNLAGYGNSIISG